MCPLSALDYLEAIWINSQLKQEALGLDLSPSFDCHFPIVLIFQWRHHLLIDVPFWPWLCQIHPEKSEAKNKLGLNYAWAFLEASLCIRSCSKTQTVLRFCRSGHKTGCFKFIRLLEQVDIVWVHMHTPPKSRIPTTEILLWKYTKMCPYFFFLSKLENSWLHRERFCSFSSLWY